MMQVVEALSGDRGVVLDERGGAIHVRWNDGHDGWIPRSSVSVVAADVCDLWLGLRGRDLRAQAAATHADPQLSSLIDSVPPPGSEDVDAVTIPAPAMPAAKQ